MVGYRRILRAAWITEVWMRGTHIIPSPVGSLGREMRRYGQWGGAGEVVATY